MRWPEFSAQFCRRSAFYCAAFALLLAITAVRQKSVTVDEFQALPSGLAIWKTGDFRFPKGTPPLSQVLPAFPLLFTPAEPGPSAADPELTSWNLGHDFVRQYSRDFDSYYFLGRGVSALALLLTLYFTYSLAQAFYGERGGLVGIFFAAFNPVLLAHGVLVTPDIYLAAAVMGFLWALDSFARNPGRKTAALLGLSLGAAALAKFTGLLLFPLLPLCLWATGKKTGAAWRNCGLAILVGWLTIHAGYLCQGSFALLGEFSFRSSFLAAVQTCLPSFTPAFLPFSFLRALDDQLAEPSYQSYLLGQFRPDGFFSFYLVALLVKSPLAILLLLPAAFFGRRRLQGREMPMLWLALFFLLFFSLGRYKNIGVRYLLFLYPIFAVWIARLAQRECFEKARSFLFVAALSLAAGTLVSWPNYLSYFNRISGGAERGHRYLLDSDLDWGQDLIGLKKFVDANHIDRIDLAYFGRVDPALYGIHYETLKETPTRRFVAISANLLWGKMYFVNGSAYWPKDPEIYREFRARRPATVIGDSIYIFDRESL